MQKRSMHMMKSTSGRNKVMNINQQEVGVWGMVSFSLCYTLTRDGVRTIVSRARWEGVYFPFSFSFFCSVHLRILRCIWRSGAGRNCFVCCSSELFSFLFLFLSWIHHWGRGEMRTKERMRFARSGVRGVFRKKFSIYRCVWFLLESCFFFFFCVYLIQQ